MEGLKTNRGEIFVKLEETRPHDKFRESNFDRYMKSHGVTVNGGYYTGFGLVEDSRINDLQEEIKKVLPT